MTDAGDVGEVGEHGCLEGTAHHWYLTLCVGPTGHFTHHVCGKCGAVKDLYDEGNGKRRGWKTSSSGPLPSRAPKDYLPPI